MIVQFVGAFLAGAVIVVSGSFLWPKITGRDRPAMLEQVHEKALETDIGKQAESVLGQAVGEDGVVNVSSISSKILTTVGGEVQKKSEEIIHRRIVEEIVRQYSGLTNDEQKEIQSSVCKPAQ